MLVWQVLQPPVHPCKTFRYMKLGIRLDSVISVALCYVVSRRLILF